MPFETKNSLISSKNPNLCGYDQEEAHDREALDKMIRTYLYISAEYEAAFGNMVWDEAIDRYQDWLVVSGIRVDPTQIEQVLINLVVNARDAMPDGGSLVIRTQNKFFQDNITKQHPELSAGEYILLTVTDDGGLSDEQTFSITVILGPFELESINDQEIDEESLLSLTASVVDTDGQADNVTFSLDDAPSGAVIDPISGDFT